MSEDTPTLKRVHRLDSIRLDSTYYTEEGYLRDRPIVTSVGIFEYKNDDNSIRRELRLPEHVFDPDSLASYVGKPVIITHDAGRVDKKNVNREHVGTILSEGLPDGDDVRCDIVIHDIDEVKRSRLRELSLGYDLVLDETPGEWNGQPYDAVQTEIRVNHLALVSDARAGDQARLNIDGKKSTIMPEGGISTMSKKTNGKAMVSTDLLKTIAAFKSRRQNRRDEAERDPNDPHEDEDREDISDLEENGAPAVADEESPAEKVQLIKDRRDRRDEEGDPDSPEAALAHIAQQDEDIDSLLEIIEALEAKADMDCSTTDEGEENEDEDSENEDDGDEGGGGVTLKIQADSADKIDAIVRERIMLGRLGDRLNMDGLESMSPMNAKKAIIKKVNPAMRLDGKGKAYVNAAFDVAVDQLNMQKSTDHQRRQMSRRADGSGGEATGRTSAERARESMLEKMMGGTE